MGWSCPDRGVERIPCQCAVVGAGLWRRAGREIGRRRVGEECRSRWAPDHKKKKKKKKEKEKEKRKRKKMKLKGKAGSILKKKKKIQKNLIL